MYSCDKAENLIYNQYSSLRNNLEMMSLLVRCQIGVWNWDHVNSKLTTRSLQSLKSKFDKAVSFSIIVKICLGFNSWWGLPPFPIQCGNLKFQHQETLYGGFKFLPSDVVRISQYWGNNLFHPPTKLLWNLILMGNYICNKELEFLEV